MRRDNYSHFRANCLVVLTKNYRDECGNEYTAGHIFVVYDPKKYGKKYKIKVHEADDFQANHIVMIPKKYLADA